MRILIAPDSFKGTLTAGEVCDIIAAAFEDTIDNCQITKLPAADGGEGLCACLEQVLDCRKMSATVSGVFGKKTQAQYLLAADGTAIIELACAAGLPLAGEHKNPLTATTRGVGELLLDAVSNGAKNILLGLGGSASNDCGAGMAQALGYRFLDGNGRDMKPVGGNLFMVRHIIPPQRLPDICVTAACDVQNPLFGIDGAAYVFAPQKGASADDVKLLDNGLRSIAQVILNDLGKEIADIPGTGAAGGTGAGVVAFLGGELKSGIDIMLDAYAFDKKLQDADVVVTGEGRLDSQSVCGKVISGVARRASKKGAKVIAVCGSCGEGAQAIRSCGVSDMFFATTVEKPMSQIVKTCRKDLYFAAVDAAKSLI